MKYYKIIIATVISVTCSRYIQAQEKPIWQNKAFSVYADSIVQENFVAKAISSTEIHSNYQSPASKGQSAALTFKFSINRKDNEMKPGVDHHFNCIAENGICTTPVIKFGNQFSSETKIPANHYLASNTSLTIRLDMNEVLNAFKKDGFYTTYDGNKIYQEDFKGLYVAGPTEPMTWDFDNLHQRPELQLKDPDGDGIYETTMILNQEKKEKDLPTSWKLTKDITAFPQYHSGYAISDAIYNMSLEEMQKAIEPDSTFRTGKEWAGVWTRDISYSIILSMAYLQTRVAMYSLMRKVKNGRIIQDTGTGGAYPNSTDRVIWAVAAWELYKATGDKDWLQQAFTIIKNSVDDDIENAHDKLTGMVRGESSFLDWREQTYPKWMQPADIFESENLGTNAVHYKAISVLAEMAGLLKKPIEEKKYNSVAQKIKTGINKYLWQPEKGYYGQYLYGRNDKILSPKSESLGEALCVLFDIADPDQRKQIISKTPVTAFGVSCIFPQIQNIPPYHNNAIWPFVESYFAQAAAKAGNEKAVLQGISAIYRPAAMFLTNKENFVADDGDYKGTQINSSNMLWSLAGNISLVHKIIFGIQFQADGLLFSPFVPYTLTGKRSLSNFTFRKAVLNIEMEGYGNRITSFMLDGKIQTNPYIPATLTGKHNIKIRLANNHPGGEINETQNHIALATPLPVKENGNISWEDIKGAMEYIVLKNGNEMLKTTNTSVDVTLAGYASYQVIAADEKGYRSFASEPIVVTEKKSVSQYEIENVLAPADFPYKGFSGNGFIEISKQKNIKVNIPITISEDGLYAIDFRYANGNGPTNTENKCAIRTLSGDEKKIGTIIFPQRGNEEWSNWGFSNPVQAFLKKGDHVISLSLEKANENMNGDINQAMLDYLRITTLR